MILLTRADDASDPTTGMSLEQGRWDRERCDFQGHRVPCTALLTGAAIASSFLEWLRQRCRLALRDRLLRPERMFRLGQQQANATLLKTGPVLKLGSVADETVLATLAARHPGDCINAGFKDEGTRLGTHVRSEQIESASV